MFELVIQRSCVFDVISKVHAASQSIKQGVRGPELFIWINKRHRSHQYTGLYIRIGKGLDTVCPLFTRGLKGIRAVIRSIDLS